MLGLLNSSNSKNFGLLLVGQWVSGGIQWYVMASLETDWWVIIPFIISLTCLVSLETVTLASDVFRNCSHYVLGHRSQWWPTCRVWARTCRTTPPSSASPGPPSRASPSTPSPSPAPRPLATTSSIGKVGTPVQDPLVWPQLCLLVHLSVPPLLKTLLKINNMFIRPLPYLYLVETLVSVCQVFCHPCVFFFFPVHNAPYVFPGPVSSTFPRSYHPILPPRSYLTILFPRSLLVTAGDRGPRLDRVGRGRPLLARAAVPIRGRHHHAGRRPVYS